MSVNRSLHSVHFNIIMNGNSNYCDMVELTPGPKTHGKSSLVCTIFRTTKIKLSICNQNMSKIVHLDDALKFVVPTEGTSILEK